MARRYDLSLPVIIRTPVEKETSSRSGKTRDISTRGVYFTIDQDLGAGAELDITLTLPAEVTRGSEVFIRAMGKVVRVDKKPENGSSRRCSGSHRTLRNNPQRARLRTSSAVPSGPTGFSIPLLHVFCMIHSDPSWRSTTSPHPSQAVALGGRIPRQAI